MVFYNHSYHSFAAQKTVSEKAELEKSYRVLQVEVDCSEAELREGYLLLAKKYHPDSGTSEANSAKFATVKDAYIRILQYRANVVNKEDEHAFDIRHTAPQHRQYLNYEGVGFGTPSQRQKQYQQYRVSRATDNVYEHELEKITRSMGEKALVERDNALTRQYKTSNAVERLVEDLIQESMAKGEFDNLSGKGKPIKRDTYNPYVDFTTHKLNQVLIDNGFMPKWLVLEKEIRQDIKHARDKLQHARSALNHQVMTQAETNKWNRALETFKTEVANVNKKINKYNMIVPVLTKQLVQYNTKNEIRKISGSEQNCDKTMLEHGKVENSSTSVGKPMTSLYDFIFNLLK